QAADVLVGAGDFGNVRREIRVCLELLRHTGKPAVLVAGNNESTEELAEACRDWPQAKVLHGSAVTISGVEFFGLGGGVPGAPSGPGNYDLAEKRAVELLAGCPRGCVLVSQPDRPDLPRGWCPHSAPAPSSRAGRPPGWACSPGSCGGRHTPRGA